MAGRGSSRMAIGSPVAGAFAPLLTLVLSVAFFAAYLLLDLREGGRTSSLLTTRLSTPSFYVAHFGGWFFWGAVVLDAVLAALSATLIVDALNRDRRAAGGVCTSAGTLLFGFAVFGCPGCIMPLFGTLGLAVFANALPLFGLEFKLLAILATAAAIAWTRHSDTAALRSF